METTRWQFNRLTSSDARKGQFLMILASLAWGSSFPSVKWGLGFMPPLIFVFFRFFAAGLMTIIFIKFLGSGNAFHFLRDRRLFVLGLFNALGYLFQFIGMEYTTAGKASLLINMNVIVVAVLSFLILRESMGRQKIIAITVSVLGVILITTNGNLQTLWSGAFIGDMVVLLGGVIWAFYIVYSKKFLNSSNSNDVEVNPMDITSAVIIITMLVLAVPAAIYSFYDPSSLSALTAAPAIIAVCYTGLVCTTIAFTLYFAGLKYISASVSAVIMLLEIVFAVALAFIFLDEVPTFYTVIGGLLIGVAIYLAGK
ncbi:MAG: DMT family transporter [Candidatus Freyarchaeota archaeon]|nr:DMT family transporter [Candidatus Jordarchaeia archaeon]MBS7268187.1 DMT family transporter [Candidatus Jordarchaeia archaeon]MBS7279446.1 DMT family transporter [Candidatus Jordarchaeia archaeon]